jgi:hypothetical protein
MKNGQPTTVNGEPSTSGSHSDRWVPEQPRVSFEKKLCTLVELFLSLGFRHLATSSLLALLLLWAAADGGEVGTKDTNGKGSVRGAYLWVNKPNSCKHGVHRQPNGPFAIILFCEDALGDHIGLIYFDRLGTPVSIPFGEKWSLSDRMWQEELWSSDVTSYAWAPGGTRLFVGTGDIYGSGGLFEVDLKERSARQIAPKGG